MPANDTPLGHQHGRRMFTAALDPQKCVAPTCLRLLETSTRTTAASHPDSGADSVLTPRRPTCHLPAETAARSTITQIYEGTNQIQRVVMARQLLK